MKEFVQTVRLSTPVDDGLHQAFSELLNFTQVAMNRIALEQVKLQERAEELNNENHTLRTANQKLRDDMQRLRRQGGANASASTCSNGGRALSAVSEAEEVFTLERSISIHDAPVHGVCMANAASGDGHASAQSKIVATASWDGTVKLYNLAAEEVVRTLGDADSGVTMGGLYDVAFARTAPELLGCASSDHSVYLWDHGTGKCKRKFTGHTDEVNGIDFHASQQVMCTASDDCKVIIWDFHEEMVLRTLDKHTKAVYGCTFLGQERHDQYLVASCCFDQKIRVFDMRDKQVVALMQFHTDDIIGIDYSPGGNLLATGSDDGLIAIWDARKWKRQQTINTRDGRTLTDNEVKRVAFSPDGGQLAAACSSGRVLVYDINQNPASPVAQLGGHSDCVFDVTWGVCPQTNSKMLVSASHDKTCRYWRQVV